MIEDVSRWVCGWQFLLYYAVLRCTHAYAKDSLFAVRFERRWYRKMKKRRVYTKRTVIRGSRREREELGGGQVNLEKVRERKGEKRRCWTRPSSIIRRKQSEKKKRKEGGAAQQGVHAANLASLLLPCGSQLTTWGAGEVESANRDWSTDALRNEDHTITRRIYVTPAETHGCSVVRHTDKYNSACVRVHSKFERYFLEDTTITLMQLHTHKKIYIYI